jgi:hypothetical protein
MDDPNGSYICPSINSYLSKTQGKVWQTTKQIGRVSVELMIWVRPDDFPGESVSMLDIGGYIFGMVQWVQTLKWSSTELKRLKIEVFLSPYQKVWCSSNKVIDRCHMNSGETSFYGKVGAAIKIWRREDYAKVLIHELLHAFDWDRLLPTGVRHNSKTKVHEAEAVVEALANVFQSLVLSKGDAVEFQRNRLIERDHALAIVLELNSRQWTTTETHVHEYCILKAALLCTEEAYQRFWSWLSLSSEKEAQRLWPEVRAFCESQLATVLGAFKNEQKKQDACISLRLVSLSLSLAPTQLK